MWTFGATASALLALSWARDGASVAVGLRPHQVAHARGGLRQQLCARPGAHSGFTEHKLLDLVIKPWRVGA